MTGVGPGPEMPERVNTQLVQTAAVFEGALAVTAAMGETTTLDLFQLHEGAARQMVEAGKLIELADAAAPDGTLDTGERDPALVRRWQSYWLTMQAAELALDGRNPGIEPPISERLRAVARNVHGDDLDRYTPNFGVLALAPLPTGEQEG